MGSRNALTDEWLTRGAQQTLHFGKLTSIIHTGTFDVTPTQYHHEIKKLPKSVKSPRDHYTEEELGVLTLAELAARRRHEENDSQGFPQLRDDAKIAGEFGKTVRKELEKTIGKPVVSGQNFLGKSKRKAKKQQLDLPVQNTLFDLPEPDQK